eukprot:106507-Pelagomonas_calceolata.AAC.4
MGIWRVIGSTQFHGNRCPYELRICNKRDWHTEQDEEHIILGWASCGNVGLTNLRTQFQYLFSPAPPSSA